MSTVTSYYPLSNRYSNIHLTESEGMVHVQAKRIFGKKKVKEITLPCRTEEETSISRWRLINEFAFPHKKVFIIRSAGGERDVEIVDADYDAGFVFGSDGTIVATEAFHQFAA